MASTFLISESAVQDCIVAALVEYCLLERIRCRHSLPYSNQQGADPAKVCADMIASLSDGGFFILEVKASATFGQGALLNAFVPQQHRENQRLSAENNIPILYAFNTVPILAHCEIGAFSIHRTAHTLMQIGLARPQKISEKGKVLSDPVSLLDFLRMPPEARTAFQGGGKVSLAQAEWLASMSISAIRNNYLVVAFSNSGEMLALNSSALTALATQLREKSAEIEPAFPQTKGYQRLHKEIDEERAHLKKTRSTRSGKKDLAGEVEAERELSFDFTKRAPTSKPKPKPVLDAMKSLAANGIAKLAPMKSAKKKPEQ